MYRLGRGCAPVPEGSGLPARSRRRPAETAHPCKRSGARWGSDGSPPGIPAAVRPHDQERCGDAPLPFTFTRLAIPEVVLVEARAFGDPRGYFVETYKRSEFVANGIPEAFVQDNCSHSTEGVLRGLHYQKDPAAQGKLVTAIRGRILDVAVDLRRGSPTFGTWVGEELSADNHRLLYVPAGFAHGFCVLSAEADVVYKVTAEYSPAHDRGIRWDDPAVGVVWPVAAPTVSAKDAALPLLAEADNTFRY